MSKRIIIRYVGGDCDGEVLDSINDVGPSPEAAGLVWMLDGAQLGAGCGQMSKMALKALHEHGGDGVSGQGFKPHYYRVTDRQETEDLLRITLTFVGNEHPNHPMAQK